jgi:hypothetical protein
MNPTLDAIVWSPASTQGVSESFLSFHFDGENGAYIFTEEDDLRQEMIISEIQDSSHLIGTTVEGDWFIYRGALRPTINEMFDKAELCLLDSHSEGVIA